MKLVRKLLFGAGAVVASTFMAAPASAYYIVYYNGPPYGQVSGAEMYCDDGSLYSSGGIITGVVAYIEYYTGQAPC